MVEGSSESSPVTSTGNESQAGASIVSKVRYAVRIDTNIGDTGVRSIAVIGSHMRQTDDGLSFQVDIENTGERALGPVVSLEVYNEQGDFIGRFDSENGKQSLHQRCSVVYKVPVPALESGAYPAMLYIDNLDEYVWSAQVNIKVP